MIEQLVINWSAQFFVRTKPVNDAAIESLFTALPATVKNAGKDLFRVVRRTHKGKKYSAICFPYDRQPVFLAEEAGISDRIHGFMLVVEDGDLVAIHKSALEVPADFKSEWLGRVGAGNVERAVATAGAKFESMRLRLMSTSRQALRTKTLEADDLENAMPMASASRYVSQRYRVRRGSTRLTATPNTGRIAQSSGRAGYKAAIDWSIEVTYHRKLSLPALPTDKKITHSLSVSPPQCSITFDPRNVVGTSVLEEERKASARAECFSV
jgi:hypothetical protein